MLKRIAKWQNTPKERAIVWGIVHLMTVIWSFYLKENGTKDLKTASDFSQAVTLIVFWILLLDWLVFDGKIVGEKQGNIEEEQ